MGKVAYQTKAQIRVLEDNKDALGIQEITYNENVAKVAIVGAC